MVRLTGRQAVNYQGVQASSPPNFVSYNRVPTPTDWQNFYLGDLWLVNNKSLTQDQFVYILVSLRNNIANWVRFAGGNGDLTSLTGNSGSTIYGDVNQNIFVIGDVTTILASGNPADNTITLSVVGGMAANTFVTSAPASMPSLLPIIGGTATPISGIINPKGYHNISVSGGLPNTNNQNDIVYWLNNAITLGDIASLGAGSDALNAITGDIDITAGNLKLAATINADVGNIKIGGNRFIHNYGSSTNTFVGTNSGNYTLSSSSANTCLGNICGSGLTTGIANTFVGSSSGILVSSGRGNVSVGQSSTINLLTGNFNVVIGNTSAVNWTSTESNNICITNPGVIADSGIIRIGTNAVQVKCFCAGIRGVTTDAADGIPVVVSSTGQLGTGDNYFVGGSWTPGIAFGGLSVGVTYASQSGSYMKIGNMVFFAGTFVLTSKGSSTGTITITGFPIMIPTTVYRNDFRVQWSTGLTLDAGFPSVWGEFTNSSTVATLSEGSITGATFQRLADTNVSNSFGLTATGFYFLS